MKLIISSFCLIASIYSVGLMGHESRPLYIEIQELENERVGIKWKVPRSLTIDALPAPFISTCEPVETVAWSTLSDAHVGEYRSHCEGGIANRKINIGFSATNPSLSTIISVIYVDKSKNTKILGPTEAEWAIPAQATFVSTLKSYLLLGMKHIALGWDHLLFIACLFFIAASWSRVLITITGFTIAHSMTLALSALNIVRLPVPPVEASIALSIVFLAWELTRNSRQSIIWKYPLAVSASFGLLHGFGFATILADTGMPENHLLTALLFFNLGVELGQIVFLLALATLLYLFKAICVANLRSNNEAVFFKTAAYMAGITASYWFIQRTSIFI